MKPAHRSSTTIILIVCMLVAGCATKKVRVGSDAWHESRIAEIQAAFDKGDITQEQYLELKNQADQIRADYSSASSHRHSSVGYHYGSGTSIGVGVGF